ncbi:MULTISPECIES: ABC transporter substrate-binding protein [unclassified Pseudomonas]|uniref:ABC transporter substrate-binding protein n=1 Tax=unclassified Pseudomonas TaxID=196821 RepID=UPI0025DFD9C6|nr:MULTISPECIES: ABC transporter substrate-binding protein [unclassified Pseudomonas]
MLERFGVLRQTLLSMAVLGGLSSGAAHADQTVRFGYAPGNDSIALFMAVEQGYLKKRGIEPDLKFMTAPPVSIAALVSNSIDIVAVGPGSTLQAIDGGVPLVVVFDGQTLPTGTQLVIVATKGTNIKTAHDLVGKKVAVIGFSSILHTMTKRWLEEKGVDYNKVDFVETGLAQMPDLLKNKQVDAAVIADPVYPRVVQDQSADKIGDVYDTAPTGVAISAYTTTEQWAEDNKKVLADIRAALSEGVDYANAHPDAVRASIVKYLKLPEDVVAQIGLPGLGKQPSVASLQWVYDVMKHQGLFQSDVDLKKVVVDGK